MDNIIYASVRQLSSTWYDITLTQRRPHEEALDLGLIQAELDLSDLSLVAAAFTPYLAGAHKPISGITQEQLQNDRAPRTHHERVRIGRETRRPGHLSGPPSRKQRP